MITIMAWFVIVQGMGTRPTFIPEPTQADCARRAIHINSAHGTMVHAHCITKDQARMLGVFRPDAPLKLQGEK